MDVLLKEIHVNTRLKLKIAWVLSLGIDDWVMKLVDLVRDPVIGSFASEYVKLFIREINPKILMQVADSVRWDIQLLMLRQTIPFAPYTALVDVDRLQVNQLYDTALLLLSRGHPKEAAQAFKRLNKLNSPKFGNWFTFLETFSEAECGNDLTKYYKAKMILKSIAGNDSFQKKYLDLVVWFKLVLQDTVSLEEQQALQSIKNGFIELKSRIQVDEKSSDVIQFYIFRIDCLLDLKPKVNPSSRFYEHQVTLSALKMEELVKELVKWRVHPYCLFLLPEPVTCSIETIPEIKKDSVIVVPKHLDFCSSIQGTISIQEYLNKFKPSQIIIEIGTGEGILSSKRVDWNQGRFEVELVVPIKPRTRYDGSLRVFVSDGKKQYQVHSTAISFRK
jgi:hypothetical protein